MMSSLEDLERRVQKIEERNKRVEADKSWETSDTRKVVLVVCTYIVIGLFLTVVNVPNPWVNAIVPSFGFLLSTLTLPFLKELWRKYIFRK